jgi:SAM-dependent methyltransferase
MSAPFDAIIGLYERHAKAWAQARGTQLVEETWLSSFSALLLPGSCVLDLGCGPGRPIARYLADRGFRVTGVDSSPAMAELFRRNMPGHDVVVADMRSLDLGRRFGGLLAWDSLFHLSHGDQRAMFPILERHSAPSAPLMFTTGPAHGEAIGELEGEPLYHASLAPEEYLDLLSASGFEVVSHVAEDPACGGRTVWLARKR